MSPDEFDRERAAVDVLLKQYEFLRNEITQCIYLQHFAILGLYTFLGGIVFISVGSNFGTIFLDFSQNSVNNLDSYKFILFLFALILIQIIICGFGSLFMKEQARNRRACSFEKAIEQVLSEKIGEIGMYWENFITSNLVTKINDQYYKNRLLGVGLPVFLPNISITLSIILMRYSNEKCYYFGLILITSVIFLIYISNISIQKIRNVLSNLSILSHGEISNILIPKIKNRLSKLREEFRLSLFIRTASLLLICIVSSTLFLLCKRGNEIPEHISFGKGALGILIFFMFFLISFSITFLWAFMIMDRTYTQLGKEVVPKREEVLNWLRKEQSRISLTGVSSFFELRNREVEMNIHVVRNKLSEKIHDIEIFPDDQDPPWESVEGTIAPKDWAIDNRCSGVSFYTRNHPLRCCEPAKFNFKVQAKEISDYIRVHLTDENSQNIGEIISIKQ